MLSSLNELDQSTFNNTAILNNLNDQEDQQEDDDQDEDEDEQYSRSNSCGSFGDCKSSQMGSTAGYGHMMGKGGQSSNDQANVSEYYSRVEDVDQLSSSNYNLINTPTPNVNNNTNNNIQNTSNLNASFLNASTNNNTYIDMIKSKQTSARSSQNDLYNLKNLSLHNR